jgi:hypothetical protein
VKSTSAIAELARRRRAFPLALERHPKHTKIAAPGTAKK